MKPVMKGNSTAFTCLGNWYDIADWDSCQALMNTLEHVRGTRDRHTALREILTHAYYLTPTDGDNDN